MQCDYTLVCVHGPGQMLQERFATGWTVRGSNPDGCEIFRTRVNRLWGPRRLLYNEYRVCFPGIKRLGRGINHPPPSSTGVKEKVEIRLATVRRVVPLFFFFVCQRMLIVFCLVTPLLPIFFQGDMSWTRNIINLEIWVLLFQRVNMM